MRNRALRCGDKVFRKKEKQTGTFFQTVRPKKQKTRDGIQRTDQRHAGRQRAQGGKALQDKDFGVAGLKELSPK